MDSDEIYELTRDGAAMTEVQVAEAESKLAGSPSDVQTRARLLGYYDRQKIRNSGARARLLVHTGWFIDNQLEPELFQHLGGVMRDCDGREAYADLKQRFMLRLSMGNEDTSVLACAASFFTLEDKLLAIDCLQKGKQLEPKNPEWPQNLSSVYRLWGTGHEESALSECKAALALTNENSKFYVFSKLPELAYLAGEYDEATEHANKLLKMGKKQKDDWNFGNSVNDGHTYLGLIALKKGDLKNAKLHLYESTKNAASPQTQTFGPNKLLAAELLELGEIQTVLEYWEQCETFWEMGKNQLQHWRDEVSAGSNPLEYLLGKKRVFFDLTRQPRIYYNHEMWDEARISSERLLQVSAHHTDDERHYGFALHVANVVLGQLALRSGDRKLAKKHLCEASAAPYAARLTAHGPDLSLCADLARTGETKVVVDFLSAMSPYWSVKVPEPVTEEFLKKAKEGRLHPDLLW